MATRFSNTLQMSNSTDALFQAWTTFFDALLVTTGGWVQTADTGQGNPATALHPTVANTKTFFRMYRMNDSLQGTAPVFMRVDYGSGAAANNPGMWFTIGSGSDGAGTITGAAFTPGANPTVSPGGTATSACNSYGSADSGRFALLMFVRAGVNDIMICSLERTVDTTGAGTGSGLLFIWGDGSGSIGAAQFTQVIVLGGGAQPPIENGVSIVLSNQATSAFSADVGVGIPVLFKGIAQQAGLGIIAVNSGDFVAEATVSFSLYGTVHTYQLGNSAASQISTPTGNTAKGVRGTTRVGIRYE